tara:strand:+ start:1334 stop:1561 length:228 start_codon:yes stop_codon:yes gene_type:complete
MEQRSGRLWTGQQDNVQLADRLYKARMDERKRAIKIIKNFCPKPTPNMLNYGITLSVGPYVRQLFADEIMEGDCD